MPTSFHQAEGRGDRRIALGAAQLSAQLWEGDVSKRLDCLINVDLPRGIALSTSSATREKHIPLFSKGRERQLVNHDVTE